MMMGYQRPGGRRETTVRRTVGTAALAASAPAVLTSPCSSCSIASSCRSTSVASYSVGNRGHAVLREQCRDQRVGIAHHRDRDALVDDAVEAEHDGHALAGAHRGQHRRQVADEQLAEELELFDHLAGGETARRGDPAVVLARVQPDGADLPAQRADQFADDVEEDAELPFDESTRYRGGGGDAVARANRPIGRPSDPAVRR